MIEILVVIGILVLLAGILTAGTRAVRNTMRSKNTRVAMENAMSLVAEYEAVQPLNTALKAGTVDANELGTFGSDIIYTQRIMRLVRGIPKNKESLEKMSVSNIASVGPAKWDPLIAYETGDYVYVYPSTTICYRAIAAGVGNSPPNATYWDSNTANMNSIVAPVDGWDNPLRYVRQALINVDLDYNGKDKDYTRDDNFDRPNTTVRSPNGRPFWVSAGPDGDFRLGDDNVYSFEN